MRGSWSPRRIARSIHRLRKAPMRSRGKGRDGTGSRYPPSRSAHRDWHPAPPRCRNEGTSRLRKPLLRRYAPRNCRLRSHPGAQEAPGRSPRPAMRSVRRRERRRLASRAGSAPGALECERVVDDGYGGQESDENDQELRNVRRNDHGEQRYKLENGYGLPDWPGAERSRGQSRNESCHNEPDRRCNVAREKQEDLTSAQLPLDEIRSHCGEDEHAIGDRIDERSRNAGGARASRQPAVEDVRESRNEDERDALPYPARGHEEEGEQEAGKRDAVGKIEERAALH